MVHWACLVILSLCATVTRAQPAPHMVDRVAESFDSLTWSLSPWNAAKGTVQALVERAPTAPDGGCLQMKVNFSGNGFEHFSINPNQPLVIPGRTKQVRIHYRISDLRFGLRLNFRDGWGREKVAGKDLVWDLPKPAREDWTQASFEIPQDWVQPITIGSFSTHNWNVRNTPISVQLLVDHLEVKTDISDVDPATGVLRSWKPEPNPADAAKALKECPAAPLIDVKIGTGVQANVFARQHPSVYVEIHSFAPGKLMGDIKLQVRDNDGQTIEQQQRAIEVESQVAIELPLKLRKFGIYHVDSSLKLSDGSQREQKLAIAYLPPYHELNAEQKTTTPYGLNVHTGGGIVLEPFKKAGIYWYRDFAWSYPWLLRAKGNDGTYSGWPNFQRMAKGFADLDLNVLPVFQQSMTPPKLEDGKVVGSWGPDETWRREIAKIALTFPNIRQWELNNEYELKGQTTKAEQAIGWKNYNAYHAAFAEVLKSLSGGNLAVVENGRAGIWPERLKDCIDSGKFAQVDIVNTHHYSGVDAPETNHSNFNTGFEGLTDDRTPGLLFDDLREVVRIAQSDGKPRQHWHTEFGWDTKAGRIVTPFQQAVYLPRAFMMLIASGTARSFWFYHLDGREANAFFDGCGLLTHDLQPKLSLATFAALTYLLPNPTYVGQINAGPGTHGYVFRSRGKLVASLWTIAEPQGQRVTFDAEQMYDFLANPITGSSNVALSMSPVYAVGLREESDLHKQTAYDVHTAHMPMVAAGDTNTTVLRISNNRTHEMQSEVEFILPQGWQGSLNTNTASVAPGQTQDLLATIQVPASETVGIKNAKFVIRESGRQIKTIDLPVFVQPAFVMRVAAIEGRPGPTKVNVQLGNRSARNHEGRLELRLPSTWKTCTPTIAVDGLAAREARDIPVQFEWAPQWPIDQQAQVSFRTREGVELTAPLIPNQHVMRRAKGITLDGILDDWPSDTRLPAWMVGSTVGRVENQVRLAWSPEGIYLGLKIADSRLMVTDPRSFWSGDVIELFLDTGDNKQHRFFETGDHQFWMVPLVEQNRVYVGQWKSKEEIPATRHDIPGIKSAARRESAGYVIEMLLPASELKNFNPNPGSSIGLNLNITVRGSRFNSEVYWPRAKEWVVQNLPKTWGSMRLVE